MSIREKFDNIADAIREKLSSTDTYTPDEMPDAIRSISGGGDVPEDNTSGLNILETKNIDDTTASLSFSWKNGDETKSASASFPGAFRGVTNVIVTPTIAEGTEIAQIEVRKNDGTVAPPVPLYAPSGGGGIKLVKYREAISATAPATVRQQFQVFHENLPPGWYFVEIYFQTNGKEFYAIVGDGVNNVGFANLSSYWACREHQSTLLKNTSGYIELNASVNTASAPCVGHYSIYRVEVDESDN